MNTEKSIYTEIPKAIDIHLITPLFTKSLLNLIKNTFSSSSTLSSSDDNIQTYLFSAIHTIETTRYLIPREIFSKSTGIIDICLNINGYKRPGEFCRYAYMSPQLFTLLIEKLETQSVFGNTSNNSESQIPVKKQLLTTLICIGSYENAAFLTKIRDSYKIEKSKVDRVCRRVITAIQSSNLQNAHVKGPGEAKKKVAKRWLKEQVCLPEWQNGFCMVNSTLIPLYQKPSYYGKTFFDRKCNYSINVQIINIPNRNIIDYASGFGGNQYDTYCFASTKLGKNLS